MAISQKKILKNSKCYWEQITIHIFTCTQNFMTLLKLYDLKNTLKTLKNRSKNSSFFDTWIYFISLWLNALTHQHEILHISSQLLREPPCQISASNSNLKYDFLAIVSSQKAKKCQFSAFFCCKTPNFWAICLKFCMQIYQLWVNTCAKF